MPESAYYGGHGDKVKRAMTRRYGPKKGREVFYATANKHGQKPGQSRRKDMLRKWSHGSR